MAAVPSRTCLKQRRVDRDMEIALKKAELLQELSDIDVNIQTKVQKQSLIAGNIFDRLGRYQGMMSRMCKKFRFMKMVLTWEESMVSFFGKSLKLYAFTEG